jgi:Fungal Zn(2)-Cys(6) binuclear cluster domain
MDIEGLINNRDQLQTLHLGTNPFALPPTPHNIGAPSSSSDHEASSLAAFSFPTISPLAEGSEFDPFQPRKRSSPSGDDATGASAPRVSPPGRKKSSLKQDAGRMSSAKDYPRRRALQACQICRARKTKCDNERPSCGSCDALGVECSYNEAPASKYLSFDSARSNG